jgi:rsbT co-antagonist protein RsbR
VDLADVITKASLSDAFVLALKRTGATISRAQTRT